VSPIRVRDILAVVDEVAPLAGAEPWDNVGLLLGSADHEVQGVFVALDPTLDALELARQRGANVLVAHHPLLMEGARRVVAGSAIGDRLLAAARQGVSVIAAHTCADAVPALATEAIAKALGLTDVRPLLTASGAAAYKVVVYVPPAAADGVAEAMWQAGAGAIGDYSECSFRAAGTGTFRPMPGATPAQGEVGRLEVLDEIRLEMLVPGPRLAATIAAMTEAHPYEEVAFDVFRMENAPRRGFGCVGKLAAEIPYEGLMAVCERIFGTRPFLPAGAPPEDVMTGSVSRVAVMPGSAREAPEAAADAGAQVLVCGEMKYHESLDAGARGVLIMAVGHAASELPLVAALGAAVKRSIDERGWGTPIFVDEAATDAARALEG
jgi:dinuclear metal center YbgI/SA1388 family protein